MYNNIIYSELREASKILDKFSSDESNIATIQDVALLLANVFKSGNKVLSCGNGGSHCDAMHFAAEMIGRYREKRVGYAALALSDPSCLSCIGNDFSYEYTFSRYIESLGCSGDILLGFSTSGNSMNILRAIETAHSKGMKVIIMTGAGTGKIRGKADIEIKVPHTKYADRIQEVHIKVIHIITLLVEKMMEGAK